MSLTHYHYDPLSEFDRFFDDAFTSRWMRPRFSSSSSADAERQLFRPRMDLHEDPDGTNVTATFDLAGMKPDDVQIDVNQDRLTISGETSTAQQQEQQLEERGYRIRERSWGKFSRTLVLPHGTKPNDVKAKMEHGLLNVTFPKMQPEQQPQRITIE